MISDFYQSYQISFNFITSDQLISHWQQPNESYAAIG